MCERLGLEAKTLEEPLYVNPSLGIRVSEDLICRGYQLEILDILLTMDLRVMDISEFDVILRMDWFTAHGVVTNSDRRWVTTYT